MDKLSQVLWRERELLDALCYRLEVEQLLLAAGRTARLAQATEDVERVVTALRETELVRAVHAAEAAATLGLPGTPSLRDLAEAVDEPWRQIMLDHREAFVEATAAVESLAQGNRTLLSAGLRSTREALLNLDHAMEGYAPDGGVVVGETTPRLVDRSL